MAGAVMLRTKKQGREIAAALEHETLRAREPDILI
jgi:hypothetical protein